MKIGLIFFLSLIYCYNDIDEMEDVHLPFEDIVTRKGYPLQNFSVITEDGYILKLFRIPGKKNTLLEQVIVKQNRKVVLLQHGLTVL